MMLRVRRMVQKELRQLFRDPRTKRIIFVSPVVQLILFGYAVNTDVREVRTFLVDHDRTVESRLLVDAFTASGYFRIVGRSNAPADQARALDRGRAVVGLTIPAGFAREVAAGRSPAVQVVVDGTNSNTASVAGGYASRIVAAFAARQAPAPAFRMPPDTRAASTAGPTPRGWSTGGSAVDLRARAWFNPSLESRVYNVPAVIGVIVLIMCLLLTALSVVREREMGTLEQLRVTPLTPLELMLGKTLPVAGIALVQLVLVAAVALLWFDIPLRGSLVALGLASVLFIVTGLSMGLILSTFSATQQEAFLAMFLVVLPAIILSGFLFPIETMPPLFQTLTLANPLRHFLEVVRDIFLKGAGLRELQVQLVVLAGMALGGMAWGVARFRKAVG